MAAPNLVNVTSIYGQTEGFALTTTLTTTLLTCASNKVYKINTITVANVDGVSNADVSVDFYDSSKTTSFALASTITVPADSTIVVVGKDNPIYLEEGDQIRGGANAAGDLELIISYEVLDDA